MFFEQFWKWWTDMAEVQDKIDAAAVTYVDRSKIFGTKEYAEAEAESKNRDAELKYKLNKQIWDSFDLKCYLPPVQVKHYAAGSFLCSDKVEAPIQHIVSISAKHCGSAPTKERWYAAQESYRYLTDTKASYYTKLLTYNEEAPAVIAINMVSGIKYTVTCHPKALDLMLARLNQAWKEGV